MKKNRGRKWQVEQRKENARTLNMTEVERRENPPIEALCNVSQSCAMYHKKDRVAMRKECRIAEVEK